MEGGNVSFPDHGATRERERERAVGRLGEWRWDVVGERRKEVEGQGRERPIFTNFLFCRWSALQLVCLSLSFSSASFSLTGTSTYRIICMRHHHGVVCPAVGEREK